MTDDIREAPTLTINRAPVAVVPWPGAPADDLSGRTIGRWSVIGYGGSIPAFGRGWVCRCQCGTLRIVRQKSLLSGTGNSCGCLVKERMKVQGKKHGFCGRDGCSPEYTSWRAMTRRCYGVGDPRYDRYGGRGITVCDRWRDDFAAFYEDMGPRPAGHTLDRIDNNGNYEPANCRWADRKTQSRNTSAIKAVVRDDGRVFSSLAAAAEAVGVKKQTVLGACSGRIKTAGGHRWRYANAEETARDALARVEVSR